MELFYNTKKEKIILLVVLFLAVFLTLFHFTDTPMPWVDEGVFTEVAKNWALHGVQGLQIEPGKIHQAPLAITAGYPLIFPVASSLYIFGTGIWQARLPMVIYMLLLVILFYLFTKKRYGFHTAILSILMLLSFAPFYGNGRPVQGEVPGLVFLVFGLWFLLFLEESNFLSKKWAILSGLAFGLSAASKPIFLIILSVVLVVTTLLWLKKIKDKQILLWVILGFISPIILWFFVQFPTLDSLTNSVPTYLRLAGNHGSTVPLTQTIITNLTKFFTESTPILFSFLLGIIVLSYVFKFFKKRPINFSISEFVIISFVILNWLSYLIGTGWYRYFFPAHTLLYLLFPASILFFVDIADKKILKKALLLIPLGLILLQFTHLVFWSDTNFVDNRMRTYELSNTLGKISPNQKILFYGSPEAIIFLKGDNYTHYFTISNTLDTKNELAYTDPSLNFIFSRQDFLSDSRITCYNKVPVDRYFLYEKIKNCKQ